MLYMVILLLCELDLKLPILKKERKDGLSNITLPPLVDTLRGFCPE